MLNAREVACFGATRVRGHAALVVAGGDGVGGLGHLVDRLHAQAHHPGRDQRDHGQHRDAAHTRRQQQPLVRVVGVVQRERDHLPAGHAGPGAFQHEHSEPLVANVAIDGEWLGVVAAAVLLGHRRGDGGLLHRVLTLHHRGERAVGGEVADPQLAESDGVLRWHGQRSVAQHAQRHRHRALQLAVDLFGEVPLLRGGHEVAGDCERDGDGPEPGVQARAQPHASTRRQ